MLGYVPLAKPLAPEYVNDVLPVVSTGMAFNPKEYVPHELLEAASLTVMTVPPALERLLKLNVIPAIRLPPSTGWFSQMIVNRAMTSQF